MICLNIITTSEAGADLAKYCPETVLGHAYELLTAGKVKTAKHAISAATMGEKKRNGALKSMRSFSDIVESGIVETERNAIDLELTADLKASLQNELLALLDEDDALAVERVLNGERLANNATTAWRRSVELEQCCAKAFGFKIARKKLKKSPK